MAEADTKIRHHAAKPRLSLRWSLLFLSLLFSLLIAELICRVVLPPAGSNKEWVADSVIGLRHAPNQRILKQDWRRQFSSWFTTNSHGDPDIERAVQKSEGVYRIAIVGDSITEASQVDRQYRFSALLERQLNQELRSSGDPGSVEVLNFGIAAIGTAQEWLYYQSHIGQFQPDLVLLIFCTANDARNNSYELEVKRAGRPEYRPFFRLDTSGRLVLRSNEFYKHALHLTTSAKSANAIQLLKSQLRSLQLLYQIWGDFRSKEEETVTLEQYKPAIQSTSTDWIQAWEITQVIIDHFAQDVTSDGARFHVVIATTPYDLYSKPEPSYDWGLPNRKIETILSSLQLNYTNLLPPIRATSRGKNELIHFASDGHYTIIGHRLVASILFPVLEHYVVQHFQSSQLD